MWSMCLETEQPVIGSGKGILDRVEVGENEHNFISTCVPLIEHPDEMENYF